MLDTLQRFQKQMHEKNLAITLLSAKNNIFYMTGLPVNNAAAANPLTGNIPMALLISAEGEPIIFAPAAVKQCIDDFGFKGEVYHFPTSFLVVYEDSVAKPSIYADSLLDCIIRYLREHPVKGGAIGVDSAFLNSNLSVCLSEQAHEAVDDLILHQRMIKSEREISLLKTATEASYCAMERVEGMLKLGGGRFSEKNIFYEMRKVLLEHHCQFDFTSANCGRFSGDIYHQPSDYIIQNGDFVRMGCGAVYKGYRSDVSRTIAVGTPPPQYERCARILREGVDLLIKGMKPGARLGDLYVKSLEYVMSNGYPYYEKRLNFGHSVGIEVEEEPEIVRTSDFIIQENMVFSIELPISIKDRCGFSHEESVVIRKNGAQLLRYA